MRIFVSLQAPVGKRFNYDEILVHQTIELFLIYPQRKASTFGDGKAAIDKGIKAGYFTKDQADLVIHDKVPTFYVSALTW